MSGIGVALVTNPSSPLGQVAFDTLERAGWQVLALNGDAADPATWDAVAAIDRQVDLLVTALHDEEDMGDPSHAIRTAWLGAKHALSLFAASGQGILLTLGRQSIVNDPAPNVTAAMESIRMMCGSALLDAHRSGIALRSNRLFCAPQAEAQSIAQAILMLTDERSAFMSATELRLSDAKSGSPDLTGKSVLVTGATSGIGRTMALTMGRLGAWVAVAGRQMTLAEETLALVREAGGDGIIVPLDVTERADWAAAAETILAERGVVHGLVNNAGITLNRPISDLQMDDLNALLAISCSGARLGMDAMTDLLAAGRGAVVNTSSVGGIRSLPGGSVYSAAKAAVIGLSRGYAAKWAASGTSIRVNTIQPGLIWSGSVARSMGEEGAAHFRAMIEPKTPLGRVGTPEDVAAVAAFLISDAAAAIDGQSITISGGLDLCFP